MRSAIVVLALFSPAACVSAPPGPPEEVAASLVADLDESRVDAAAERFDRVAGHAEYCEKLYPILYEAARERFDDGDCARSAELLRFMAPRYPDASAVREALLYSLFLVRAEQDPPQADLLEETDRVLAELRSCDAELPVWVDLVEAQQAADCARLPEARDALARFQDRWEGRPSTLLVYVEDLERYLSSNKQALR